MAITINGQYGDLVISQNVISKLAGATATKCYGVVGMASKNTKDGLVSLLNKDNISKGVNVRYDEDGISIELHILVEYGVNINAICDSIIHNVSYKVEAATDIKVKKVEVIVESVRISK